MQYRVRILDEHQQVRTLSIAALDAVSARREAEALGHLALDVCAERATRSGGRGGFSLLLFAEELHALVSAGLDVVESVEALAEKESAPGVRAVLRQLREHLVQGLSLSSALGRQPACFPPLFIGIVRAAEGTSDLPRSLARYASYERRMASVRHQVISAVIYPAILLVVGGAVAAFLLGYVVPRFSAVYASAGREIPWASRLLLDWGRFAGAHALALTAAGLAAATGVALLARAQLRAHGWWRLLHAVPGARQRLGELELSRLYLTLGMLLDGGITLPESLLLVEAVASPARRRALDQVRRDIENGQAVSEALARSGLSTPVALRLVRVGERTGQLGQMFSGAAAFYEGETTRWLERFSKVFEPVLMAAIGLVIGLIVILLYMPVFDLAGSLQ